MTASSTELEALAARVEALEAALAAAIERIEDMLSGDDGQAVVEARKELPILLRALAKDHHPMDDVAKIAAGKKVGPILSITATCFSCAYERSESYRVQGDSGSDVYCDHPVHPGKRVGDTRWTTPDWCPAGEKMRTVRAHLMEKNDDQ